MTRLYLIAAIVGGTLFVCQLFLGLLGVGHDVDHDFGGDAGGDAGDDHGHHGHDKGSLFWGMFSIRALIAALTAFGLAGMAASRAGGAWPMSLAAAAGVGVVAMLVVAGSLQLMNRMTDDGTERIQSARGATGTVYLSIPGDRAGLGKVHLDCKTAPSNSKPSPTKTRWLPARK